MRPGDEPGDGPGPLGPIESSVGRFTLRRVDPAADLELIAAWMNEPEVAEFWHLAGPAERTAAHLAYQQRSPHLTPYVGYLDGVPMGYWELYWAALDPLAKAYPAGRHDAGIHLLLGPDSARGRGIGTALLRAVSEALFAADPRIESVVAEPDVHNTRSIRAFERAGFSRSDDIDLPGKRAALMLRARPVAEPYDLVGVGIGPFNLALAALADAMPDVRTLFFDAKPEFRWHPGLLFDDAELQVPFLADLVTMVDPTSQWSFLNYLRAHERLFPFYFAERFHVPRREYDHYCRWVSDGIPACRFGITVEAVDWDADRELFLVTYVEKGDEQRHCVTARNVVLGVGTEPVIPEPFANAIGDRVFHAADYLDRRPGLARFDDLTVIGSGQTGAEVFLDLLRAQPEQRWRLRWLTRSPAFAPMEYSKLGLEHFTPDYTDYFRELAEPVRDQLVSAQWQLYKAISADTIADIHNLLYERGVGGAWPEVTITPGVSITAADMDGSAVELSCQHREQGRDFAVRTDAVVLATGYAPRRPALLDPLRSLLDTDPAGRYRVDGNHRVALADAVTGGLYVQNAEAHTHGVGAPDLGLGAYRAAVILNAITGEPRYPLPSRTAFTTFGAPVFKES